MTTRELIGNVPLEMLALHDDDGDDSDDGNDNDNVVVVVVVVVGKFISCQTDCTSNFNPSPSALMCVGDEVGRSLAMSGGALTDNRYDDK